MKLSEGAQPNSVDVFGDILYVSNVGNAANNFASNITGYLQLTCARAKEPAVITGSFF
jgi:hypothetical protein